MTFVWVIQWTSYFARKDRLTNFLFPSSEFSFLEVPFYPNGKTERRDRIEFPVQLLLQGMSARPCKSE